MLRIQLSSLRISTAFCGLIAFAGITACNNDSPDTTPDAPGVDGGIDPATAVTVRLTEYGAPSDAPVEHAPVVITETGKNAVTVYTDATGMARAVISADATVSVLSVPFYSDNSAFYSGKIYTYYHVNPGQEIRTPSFIMSGHGVVGVLDDGATIESNLNGTLHIGACLPYQHQIPVAPNVAPDCVQADGRVTGYFDNFNNVAGAFGAFMDQQPSTQFNSATNGSWTNANDIRTVTINASGDHLANGPTVRAAITHAGVALPGHLIASGTGTSQLISGYKVGFPKLITADGLMTISTDKAPSVVGLRLKQAELRHVYSGTPASTQAIDLSLAASQNGFITPSPMVNQDGSAGLKIYWTASPDAASADLVVGYVKWAGTHWFGITRGSDSQVVMPSFAGTPLQHFVDQSGTRSDPGVVYAHASWLGSYERAIDSNVLRGIFEVPAGQATGAWDPIINPLLGFHYPIPADQTLSLGRTELDIDQPTGPYFQGGAKTGSDGSSGFWPAGDEPF